jgi:hypothetical protein
MRGKAMASYPQELAQDAAYESHTNRLTELWSLPKPAQGLNTNNNNLPFITYFSALSFPVSFTYNDVSDTYQLIFQLKTCCLYIK